MSEDVQTEDAPAKKASKLPLIIGLLVAILGGGGGFFAVSSGMIFGHESSNKSDAHVETATDLSGIMFVEVDPLTIMLGTLNNAKHLRFRTELEVNAAHEADVRKLLPRIVDVLNSYLRALELSDMDDPAILTKLRSQMLRRIQVVTGPNHVNDLLIMEFVLN